MKTILQRVDERARQFEEHALFVRLRSNDILAERKLDIVPPLAHFVMTFADIYTAVLRDEPTNDPLQRLVNAHTREDGHHWKWYLNDLDKLGCNPRLSFSDSLRFLWSEPLLRTRMLSYEICRMGLHAAPLDRLVLVLCIEATGAVTLRNIAPVGDAVAARTGAILSYFGSHHLETENDHTLEQDDVHREIEAMDLTPADEMRLTDTVEQVFQIFRRGADDLLHHLESPGAFPGAATRSRVG